jgi:hypothetical protein
MASNWTKPTGGGLIAASGGDIRRLLFGPDGI